MTALSIVGPFVVGIGIVDCPNMPGVKSSSEAPSHFRIPICFLPSLAEIIISPDVLIHLLKEFSKVYGGFLAKYWVVGPGQSPLIMASITISSGTVGA
jgi:hypothetical protein